MEGEIDFKSFKIPCFYETVLKSGENLSEDDTEQRLNTVESYPGYQTPSQKIAENVTMDDDEEDDDEEEESVAS